jgi:hypothetical protein
MIGIRTGIGIARQGALLNQAPAILRDGNTVAWYDIKDISTITKDGSNFVSRWNDKLGSGHDLIQATGTKQPLLDQDGVIFDGIDDFMKTVPFTLNQPENIYLLVRQKSHASVDRIIDGNSGNSGSIHQDGPTGYEGVKFGSGIEMAGNINTSVNTWIVIRALFYGTGSKLFNCISAEVVTNTGTSNMGGITLAAFGNSATAFGNIEFHEVIVRKIDDSNLNEELITRYLLKKQAILSGNYNFKALKDDFISRKSGAILHFNMATFTNEEQGSPNLVVDTFAPTNLSIDNWLDACVAGKLGYAILTAKHTDGFKIWPTTYAEPSHNPYSITETAWYNNNGNLDIVGSFISKCRSKGLKAGLYFSLHDGTFEARTGTNESNNTANYLAMIKLQLTELLAYGLDYIWLDAFSGTWFNSAYITHEEVYDFIKTINPNTLVVINGDGFPKTISDVQEFEFIDPPVINYTYSESVRTIRKNGQWFYRDTVGQLTSDYLTSSEIKAKISYYNNRKSNYLIGLTPDKSGRLPSLQVSILNELGEI